MTPEEQRIAIAEACGKLNKPECRPTIEELEAILASNERLKVTIQPDGSVLALPDYIDDLNAMHVAENTLSEYDKINHYDYELSRVCNHHQGNTIRATSAQRAEAFLRAIGKWKDEP